MHDHRGRGRGRYAEADGVGHRQRQRGNADAGVEPFDDGGDDRSGRFDDGGRHRRRVVRGQGVGQFRGGSEERHLRKDPGVFVHEHRQVFDRFARDQADERRHADADDDQHDDEDAAEGAGNDDRSADHGVFDKPETVDRFLRGGAGDDRVCVVHY